MDINQLPVDCISAILAFTSPKDACRSAAVSPAFRSAADSDDLWIHFLPSDYQHIISQAPSNSPLNSLSKKALYFHLCDHLLFIGTGNSTLALEKESGKKCYMIGARDLDIIWGNSPQYWNWKSIPQSRFSEVAELRFVCWLDIKGKIEAKNLSPKTNYAAYLVFKLDEYSYGFDRKPVLLRVYYEGEEVEEGNLAILDPPEESDHLHAVSHERADGWMEIEMGEIFSQSEHDHHGSILFNVMEVDDYNGKCGLIVEGIEIRPKLTLGNAIV